MKDEMVIIALDRYEKLTYDRNELISLNSKFVDKEKVLNRELLEMQEELSKEHSALLDLNEETKRLKWFKAHVMGCLLSYDAEADSSIINIDILKEIIKKEYKKSEE